MQDILTYIYKKPLTSQSMQSDIQCPIVNFQGWNTNLDSNLLIYCINGTEALTSFYNFQ